MAQTHRLLCCLVSAALLAFAARVDAIVYVAADFRTLVSEAHTIVLGRIVSLEPEWTEGRRGIETLLSIEVERTLKGSAGESIVVRTPGGQMGPYLSVMPGAPRFATGEEVVLFLAGAPPAVPHILALSQGVFRVVRDPATGARTVVPELMRAVADASVQVVRGDLTRKPTPLGRFILDVQGSAVPPLREKGVR
jgi:hypothetical protein